MTSLGLAAAAVAASSPASDLVGLEGSIPAAVEAEALSVYQCLNARGSGDKLLENDRIPDEAILPQV